MNAFQRVVGLVLLALLVGCTDFQQEGDAFCARHPERCGDTSSGGGDGGQTPSVSLTFTTAPQTVQVGRCSAVATVQLQDAQGRPASVTADTAVTLSALPAEGLQFFAGADCTGGEVTAVHLSQGTSSASFSFKGTRSGAATLRASAGSASGSQAATFNPGPPAALAFSASPLPVKAGECTQVQVQVRDGYGNPAPVAASTSISVSAGGAPLQLSANSGCTDAVTDLPVPQGTASASIYVRGVQLGRYTLMATSAGLTSGTADVLLTAGPAFALAFTTAPQTVAAGSCSGVATVQLRDAFSNPVKVDVDTSVVLSPSAGLQFFTDAGCAGAPVTAATMLADTSTASFYFKGTVAGGASLDASAGGASGSQAMTITAGAPAALAFSQPTLTVVAGACTAVTLQLTDSYGNPAASVVNQAVSLSASPAAGFTFAAGSSCATAVSQATFGSGQSSVTLYVRGTVAGSVTATASKSGLTPGTQTVRVNGAAPFKLAFRSAAQAVEVGTCSGMATVEVQDSFGNPTLVTANTLVNLTGNSANITFSSDAACGSAVTAVTVPSGQGSASFYFKDTSVESVTIIAASNGLSSTSQTQTVNPRPPNALAITTAAQTVPVGNCSGVVTVQTRAQGTATPVTSTTAVTLAASPSTGFTFYSNSTCTMAVTQVTLATGQSSASFFFKGTKVGTVAITASATGLTDATQNETLTAQAPTSLVFTTPPRATVAGACSALVTVMAADSFGNASSVTANTVVNLSQSSGQADSQFKFYSDPDCTKGVVSVVIPTGQSTASFYYVGAKARTVTLTAAATGLTNGTQDHTITPGAVSALAFSANTPPETLLAGTCALRTIERQDAYGNPVPDSNSLTVSLGGEDSSGATLADFFLDSSCTTLSNQQVVIPAGSGSATFYFKGISGGINATASFNLTASATGFNLASQVETIIPTVRTGSCTMGATANSTTCNIVPLLNDTARAFLVFQATSLNQSSDFGNVRCYFSGASRLTCERAKGSGSSVSIRWSVAEFPSGVAVQHASLPCAGETTVINGSAVAKDRTFLLLSSEMLTGDQGSTVPRLAELTATTQAEIRKTPGSGCTSSETNSLQVVDYAGASVQRGLASMTSGTSTQLSLSPAVAADRSILLYSYNYSGTGTKICDRMVRGALSPEGGKVLFSRGEGDAASCTGMQIPSISWEVVQFPPGTLVQQVTQSQPAGTASSTITLPVSVDPSRTFVIAGGQWASGQVHGEGRYAGGELISEMRAQAVLTDAKTVTLTRQTSNASATFTLYVVQLKP